MVQKINRILLASSSPRRFELLRSLGVDVSVISNGYDEIDTPGSLPIEVAMRHARGKLESALARHAGTLQGSDNAIVIAADTTVDVDGTAFGKPRDDAEAVRMLTALSGRKHIVHTAFAFLPVLAPVDPETSPDQIPKEPEITAEINSTWVRFYKLSPDEIKDYVATEEPLDKAGAYGIQGFASALIAGIEGDFYTVMGFPLGRFLRSLRELGLTLQ